MFKKIKNLVNMKKNMRTAKNRLAELIRFYAKRHEHFKEGYAEGVCDYFEEKEKYVFPHLEVQARLWCIFLENKFDVFLQEMIDESSGWDEIGRMIGYNYFHIDELLTH